MKKHNFSAGPSILSEEVFKQASEGVLELNHSGLSILEISHRSDEFIAILEEAKALVFEFMQLDNEKYEVLFLQGGASMEFLRIPYNLLNQGETAAYLDTGKWASNAIKEAKLFGNIHIVASSKDQNYNYIPKNYTIPDDVKYLHITSNNTIYGTQIQYFKKENTSLICDMSSDIFSRTLDFSMFDLIYAGAQKNLGPAGVNLVVIKKEILGKTNRPIPSILDYQKHIDAQSMFNTPPVFAIYTMLLNLKWLKNQGGISVIEKRNQQKADLLYREIDRNPLFEGTAQKEDRSMMNVTFVLKDLTQQGKFAEIFKKHHISGINGHRIVGGYRASIYNAMPLESVKVLIQAMQELESIKK
ncbi:3-phosphoserine/phosphohydroxythreonine transaminase [Flavobacterium sp.]|uniref:3-phosphoserine/phosphohydroxythreonine transaminase n=1 Tax=Flavobacterium sp. TaxID=239 RepID=UPI00263523C1|nr:3-phosphoserine/phosphohydroxythreonine transaminase [Flavobacterium sp.]MDD3005037.1 3-phosphoserine/phosphohydroxythreonine transaminase [Flavobacterium sp.]